MKTRRILTHLAICSVALISTSVFFFYQRSVEAEKVHLFIRTSFKDTIKSGNIYQNAKDIHAIESLGLAKCIKLSQLNSNRPFYISSNFMNCGLFNELQFKASNGIVWNLQYSLPVPISGILLYGFGFLGIALIGSFLFELINKRSKELEKNVLLRQTENEMLKNLTQQARHDVASPLSAVRAAAKFPGIDEKIRNLLEMAITRTEEIVHSMETNIQRVEISPTPLFRVMGDIATEKKVEYPEVKIYLKELDQNMNVLANDATLKRIISNLINNAIEAGAKEIHIENSIIEKNFITLKIEDDGSGLPPEMYLKIFEKGFSFKKTNGSGLGLFHAKSHLESWGGSISVCRSLKLPGLLVELYLKSA